MLGRARQRAAGVGSVARAPARVKGAGAFALARWRVRAHLRPVIQTAVAAALAWSIADMLLHDERPAFASIAAIISLGVSYGQRGERALQLVAGVVVGLGVADVLIHIIGTGAPQIGLMVVLAMTVALVLGGGEVLVSEAAVSAILLMAIDPAAGQHGFSPDRILEALIGGGSALGVSAVFFPPDPVLEVARAAQAVFGALGRSLERIATALDQREHALAEQGLAEARAIDPLVRELEEALRRGHETARLAPPRRATREQLDRYGASLAQIDFAVRDTRVLARHALRAVRSGEPAGAELARAVRELELATWALAGAFDDPARGDSAQGHALTAAALASDRSEHAHGDAATQVVGQVRSTAADLRRAAGLATGDAEPEHDQPTEELLAAA